MCRFYNGELHRRSHCVHFLSHQRFLSSLLLLLQRSRCSSVIGRLTDDSFNYDVTACHWRILSGRRDVSRERGSRGWLFRALRLRWQQGSGCTLLLFTFSLENTWVNMHSLFWSVHIISVILLRTFKCNTSPCIFCQSTAQSAPWWSVYH